MRDTSHHEQPSRLGYACISTILRKDGIFTSRTATLAKIRDMSSQSAISHLQNLAMQNIADLERILAYNETNGIRFFRISSGLIPHYGNPKLIKENHGPLFEWATGSPNALDFARDALGRIGMFTSAHGHRLSMHPGQYNQLGSPTESVVAQTAIDLGCHAHILDAIEEKCESTPLSFAVLIIHGGGVYGDRDAAAARWKIAWKNLAPSTSRRIVLENDELWSIDELLPICEELHVPLCVDFFHDTLRQSSEPAETYMPRVFALWGTRRAKCHISEQAKNARRGAHADDMSAIPDIVLTLMRRPMGFDVMIESKLKDETTIKLLKKHFRREIRGDSCVEWVLKSK